MINATSKIAHDAISFCCPSGTSDSSLEIVLKLKTRKGCRGRKGHLAPQVECLIHNSNIKWKPDYPQNGLVRWFRIVANLAFSFWRMASMWVIWHSASCTMIEGLSSFLVFGSFMIIVSWNVRGVNNPIK